MFSLIHKAIDLNFFLGMFLDLKKNSIAMMTKKAITTKKSQYFFIKKLVLKFLQQ